MHSTSVEPPQDRLVRELRAAAEQAVDALVDALALNSLPPLPGLAGARITVLPGGVHVELGGCNVRTLQAIADCLAAHARCTDRVVQGASLPPGLAELPVVRTALRAPTAERAPSVMTLRTYRITPAGERTELSHSEIHAEEPYERPITDRWPDCECRRCAPLLRRPAAGGPDRSA
jgi:hypothetical protein